MEESPVLQDLKPLVLFSNVFVYMGSNIIDWDTSIYLLNIFWMKEILKKKEHAIFIFVHPAQSNYTVHSIISAVNKMDL